MSLQLYMYIVYGLIKYSINEYYLNYRNFVVGTMYDWCLFGKNASTIILFYRTAFFFGQSDGFEFSRKLVGVVCRGQFSFNKNVRKRSKRFRAHGARERSHV